MKMNKIISCIIALTMMISMFSVITVSAASLNDISISYTFANDKDGDADGTVTISGIDASLQSTITNINLYWGKNATEKLDNYYNIANYTVEGYTSSNGDWDSTKLSYENDSITYTFSYGRLIPEGATHVIAQIQETHQEQNGVDKNNKPVYVTVLDNEVYKSFEIPVAKRLNADKSKMQYNMVWASDYHAENTSILSGSEQRKGVEDFVRMAAMGREVGSDKFKGVIFNGDISNSSIDYEYAIIEQIMEENNVDFPVYYTTGNHDTAVTINNVVTDVSAEAAKAMKVRFDKLEKQFGLTFDHSDPWSYETYINGHHYIFLSTPYITSYALTGNQALWLEEKLCYDEKSGIPTFVFTHLPYISIGGYEPFPGAETFAKIIARHPSAIVISSHVHFEPDQDRLTYEIVDGTPAIDTGAVTYTNTKYKNAKGETVRGRGGYSKYLEFYSDRIIMRTRNVKTQTWVSKADHIIYVDDYGKTIAEDFSIASSNEGVIEAGEVLTAKLGGADIPDGYSVEWFNMSGTSLGTGATYTVETAGASVSAKITRSSDGAYAYALARHGKVVEDFIIDEETGDGEGTVNPGGSLVFNGPTTVKYYDDIVYLYGSVDASYAGQEATMALMSKADYPDMSKAKYFGYCTIASDGSYMFKFKASDVAEGDIFLIKAGNAAIAANEVGRKGSLEEIVEVTATINDDNTVAITTKNVYADAMNAKVILAMYNPLTDELVNTKISDYKLAFSENGELQSWVSEAVNEGTYVKVFLWTNLTDIVPLSNGNDRVDVPVTTTEEITE